MEDGITAQECTAFLEFAVTFLSNIGNYYVCLPCLNHVMYANAEF